MKTDNQYLNERLKTAEELWDKYETLLPENALDEEGCETGVTLTREQRSTDVIYYDDFFKALTEHDNEIKKMIDEIELFKPCSQCGGEGKICIGEHFVSRDMAIDACDLSLEGQHFDYEYTQCNCAGGMIPKEIEEIQQEFTKLREKI